ncbi:leader peptidase (prepilin peptidase)/N-methyltransferase [Micromonospora sp. Llam0]|uniref:prepilin peptidase n=1 Tax=Micromonospora sp. Llam0 TaxID=2485143 RepID=UPI000F4A963E|nr:A24 family peptidase [Micromonospora sp. Llam0]ROO52576.1 leader peptidase (prepilin peptidase)/N-methyltransferase [Micromonospora sp. Llam0]
MITGNERPIGTGSTPAPAGRRPGQAGKLLRVLLVLPLLRRAAAVHSVAPGEPWRTGCPRCGTPLGAAGPAGSLPPMASLSPLARCGGCGARVGPPPFAVEVVAVAALAALVSAGHPWPVLLALIWWAAWMVPLVFVDLAVHRLPDRLTYPAAAGTWALLGAAVLLGEPSDAWLRAVIAGTGVAALFAATTLVFGARGFGLGDAKLALSVGAVLGWFGWPMVLLGLLVAFVGSGGVAVVLLVARRIRWTQQLPFGPFLVLGAVVGVLLAGRLPAG